VPWDLRHGDWREVLADVECDALITDPPYSARTHEKQVYATRPGGLAGHEVARTGIPYEPIGEGDALELVHAWHERTRGWMCIFTDHNLVPAFERELKATGRTVFCPVPIVQYGMNVRLAGDGPSNWGLWMLVARPKALCKWGTLPGAYTGNPGRNGTRTVVGAKPLWLMQGIVRDYTRPGDLVCDPFAGSGTTLLAAEMLGRNSVGAEIDADTHAMAVKRLTGAREQTELAL
jgi:23S rRNA G2445 N2-methylase RlmL